MRKLCVLIFLSLVGLSAFAQTNKFPSNGKVGIGTVNPNKSLSIFGNNSSDVGISLSNGFYDNNQCNFFILKTGNAYIVDDQRNAGVIESYNDLIFSAASGVNTVNPSIKFQTGRTSVIGNTRMLIDSKGNIGIGTLKPSNKLDVNGNIQISNSEIPMGLITEVRGLTPLLNMSMNFRESNRNNQYVGAAFRIDSRDYFSVFQWKYRAPGTSDETSLMELNRNGQLGLGTKNPGEFKLAVKGSIGASEIKVLDVKSWADFVFEDSYSLRNLIELETFIQKNKHLPDIPSEIEIKEQGINIADMDAMLLRKIEELTLYVIDQNKKINKVIKENKELRTEIEILNAKGLFTKPNNR